MSILKPIIKNILQPTLRTVIGELSQFPIVSLPTALHFASFQDGKALSELMVKNSSDEVETWKDISAFDRDATQPTTSKKPIYIDVVSTLYNRPALLFDNDDDLLETANIADLVTDEMTVFVIGAPSGSSGILNYESDITNSVVFAIAPFEQSWNFHGPTNQSDGAIRVTTDKGHLFTMLKTSTTQSISIEGHLDEEPPIASSASMTTLNAPFKIGSQFAGPGEPMFIGEIVVYAGALPQDEIDQVEKYLLTKWRINTPLTIEGSRVFISPRDQLDLFPNPLKDGDLVAKFYGKTRDFTLDSEFPVGQSLASEQGIYNSHGFRLNEPGVRYDGIDDKYEFASDVNKNTNYTFAVVEKWDEENSPVAVLGGQDINERPELTLTKSGEHTHIQVGRNSVTDGSYSMGYNDPNTGNNHRRIHIWTQDSVNPCVYSLNGIERSSVAASPIGTVQSTPIVGSLHSTTSLPYSGDIGDVIFYDRALSGAEIVKLYNMLVAKYPVSTNYIVPDQLASLLQWNSTFYEDDLEVSGVEITKFLDLAGNGNELVQNAPASKANMSPHGFNGFRTASFDIFGSNFYEFSNVSLFVNIPHTIFIVMQWQTVLDPSGTISILRQVIGTDYPFMTLQASGNDFQMKVGIKHLASPNTTMTYRNKVTGGIDAVKKRVVVISKSGTPGIDSIFWPNGNIDEEKTNSNTNLSSTFDGSQLGPFGGKFCELVIFNEDLSVSDKQGVANYLKQKWKIN